MATVARIRLGDAAKVLASGPSDESGEAFHAKMSKIHSAALSVMMLQIVGGLSGEDISQLIIDVLEVPWHGQDGDAIVKVLSDSPVAPEPRKARRAMQDFIAFTDYFTEPQWINLTNPDVSMPRWISHMASGPRIATMPPATLQDYVKQWLVVRWCHLSISRVVAWRLAQGRRRLLVAWVLVEWYVEHKVCFPLFF